MSQAIHHRVREVVWALVAAVIVLAASSPLAQTADSKQQATTLIQEAIKVLERKDYVGFWKTFGRPAEVERLVARFGSLENLAAEFGSSDRPTTLLKALHAALKIEPSFSADGTRATYKFDPPVGQETRLVLQKIGDRWYLAD